jgi:hypothetical protein
MIVDDCARVKLVRTAYGERSVMIDVPAAVTTSGIFASVASGATASAAGVTPNPARNCTLSLTISSCARPLRIVGHGTVVLDDHLHLLARDRVAVLLLEKPDRRGDLLARRLLLAGHRQDEPIFTVSCACDRRRDQRERGDRD